MSPLTRRQFIGAAAGAAFVAAGPTLPAAALTINPRSSWAIGLPPKGPLADEDVRFLIVHHSASHNGHTAADVPGILRGWYHYHTGPDKGWPDIAYNFIVDSAGGIWEGRQGSIAGAVAGSATGGNQGFTQLVCVIGDTNLAPATSAAHGSLVRVLGWLADCHQVSTAPGAEVTFESRGSNRWPAGTSVTTPTISGHRDMSRTSCPGDRLYGYVAGTLRSDVEAARGVSDPPPARSTTTTSSAVTTTTTGPTATTTTIEIHPTATSDSSATSVPPPNTTLPAAIDVLPANSGPLTGLMVTAGALVAAGAGILLWRSRRMGG